MKKIGIMNKKRSGRSYAKRVADVNRIYDTYVRTGLSNREIWRRYVYPQYGISERTFYNLLKASADSSLADASSLSAEGFLFPELFYPDDCDDAGFFKKTE